MPKKLTPQFKDPAQVVTLTEELQKAENLRANDRALIDNLANGKRPYTNEEAEKYQIHVNVNWLEMTNLIIDAMGQVNNALIYKERYFTATCLEGKIEKRDGYSETFTRLIHKPLNRGKTGRQHMNVLKSRNASVVLHGIGVVMWMNSFAWLPRFIPLEDILIPTDTLVDFSNMPMFAVNLYLTLGEFFAMTHGEKVDKGWNMAAVNRILDDTAKPQPTNDGATLDWQNIPEKRVSWFKQNRAMYDADSAKTVKLRMVLYMDPDEHKWYRVLVLREGTPNQPAEKDWIYDGRDEPFADDIDEILCVLYGDNNVCPPLKYHSVRGLGQMLYGPSECNNRMRCELVQHTLQAFKTILRNSNPPDRDRPRMMDLSEYSVLEDGWSIVPKAERHQIDPGLAEFAMSQMKQIMSEGSANYVQDINDGTKQPMTATETSARVQAVNVKVSSMLGSLYTQETYYYEEIVRRLLAKSSGDKEAAKFREECTKHGIPANLLKPECWLIKPERVLGAGDQFLATQEANTLLSQSQRFDPAAQRTILRKWVTTTTRNPAMGELLVPEAPKLASDGVIAAENVFATLMAGVPASIREGIERSEYVEALLGMLKARMEKVTAIEEVPTGAELIGLQTVLAHVEENLKILAKDPMQKQLVKELGDFMGQLGNNVKMLAERYDEAQQAKSPDPEMDAKIESMRMQAQTKAQIAQMNAQQKMTLTDAKTQQAMQIKQAQFRQKMEQDMERHRLEMQALMERTEAELAADAVTTGADIANATRKTNADVKLAEKRAAATASNGADK